MNARHHAAVPVTARHRRLQRGFTLLEVLVSLGIIIGALAGIAALLPAAGSRLAEATDIDRAGAMAANARSDLVNRGAMRYQLWSQATGGGAGTLAIVFGEGLTVGGTGVAIPNASTIALAGTASLGSLINVGTGFQARDGLQTNASGAVTGYEPGICYGCMLSSSAAPSGPGTSVRLSTVVFRRPAAQVKQFSLAPQGGGLFSIGSGAPTAADRQRFLPGCSWVLVAGSGEPRWFQVASSWTTFPTNSGAVLSAATGTSFVVLMGSELPSGTLQVYGFEGLLQVDEQFVTLE